MKRLTIREIRTILYGMIDTASLRNGVYTVRRGFFFTNGWSAEKLVDEMTKKFRRNGVEIEVIDSGEVWKVFRGGASIANQSHWFVKFRVTSVSEGE